MIAIGTTSTHASNGLPLRDNGICGIDERGTLFAVSEERLSGQKHDAGHHRALAAALNFFGRPLSDVSAVGVSSCTDPADAPKSLSAAFDSISRVNLPSHHYSHALSAFASSGFKSSLVLVADAGGNTIARPGSTQWWNVPREQTTLWRAQGTTLELIERRHAEPGAVGYGEWFRAITYFLGWHSHTLSGNTMALAASGNPDAISGNLFDIVPNLDLLFHPQQPIDLVRALLRAVGYSLDSRARGQPLEQGHRNLAAFLQRSLSEHLRRYLVDAQRRFGISNICLSGGVAQNCVTNAELVRDIGLDHLHVSPFAGDTGQAVGNALYARLDAGLDLATVHADRPFFGPRRRVTDGQWASRCADALARGAVIALWTGRSEFGARALGHRSVLGDPCASGVAHRIKTGVKRREDFMPLAPVVHPNFGSLLAEDVPVSRTMVYAPTMPSWSHAEFGDALHIDQTARVQVAVSDSFVGQILHEFQRKTGRNVLINTSFNQRGAPIAESRADAIAAFDTLDIDVLVAANEWFEKPYFSSSDRLR